MAQSLPPNPGQFRNLYEWARQLYEYIISTSAIKDRLEPSPILMSQRLQALDARAAQDGLMLFDPMDCTPIVSVNGMWYPIREAPLFELTYNAAFNVDGGAIGTGGVKIPFDTAALTACPWAVFNVGTTDFDLKAGTYLVTGHVCLAKSAGGGASTAVGYLAASSALTTPIGNVNIGPAYLHSANDMLIAPIRGQVIITADGTYAMVVNASDANLIFGKAHGISGFGNVYASIGISKVGIKE